MHMYMYTCTHIHTAHTHDIAADTHQTHKYMYIHAYIKTHVGPGLLCQHNYELNRLLKAPSIMHNR